MVPPCSDRISRVPPYSRTLLGITHTGLSPTMANLSRLFWLSKQGHWPGPRSLATTNGVSVDVLSSGYLDVSVRQVRLLNLCIQFKITLRWGFPIRKSTDQSLLSAPRSLSLSATSFIASQCQGIHEMPLRRLIFKRRDKPNAQLLLPTTTKKPCLSVMGYITEILISSNRIDQKNLFTMRYSIDDILVGKRSDISDRCRTRMVGP